jgi:hypothetical protein
MNKVTFKFTFQSGKDHEVHLEGIFLDNEGFHNFEKCSGVSESLQCFKTWLETFVNRKALSEFLIKQKG